MYTSINSVLENTHKTTYQGDNTTAGSTGTMVYFLVSPTQVMCLKSKHQSKGHHVSLEYYAAQGSSLPLDGVLAASCWFFFV